MTGNKVLLDTNIISALLKGDSLIANQIDLSEEIFIPAIVLGELYYGAAYSTQVERNNADILDLKEAYKTLPVNAETAEIYGLIKATLRKSGTPIPENDVWIAALAIQYEITLITRDKHFNNIASLKIASW